MSASAREEAEARSVGLRRTCTGGREERSSSVGLRRGWKLSHQGRQGRLEMRGPLLPSRIPFAQERQSKFSHLLGERGDLSLQVRELVAQIGIRRRHESRKPRSGGGLELGEVTEEHEATSSTVPGSG